MPVNNPMLTPNFRKGAYLSRYKLLGKENIRFIFIVTALSLVSSVILSFKQVSKFLSISTVQLQNLNLATSSSQFAAFDFSPENDSKLKIENSAELFKKEILLTKVVTYLKQHPQAENIYFPSPKDRNIFSVPKLVEINTLSAEQIKNILREMQVVKIDPAKDSISLLITARTPTTAEVVSDVMTQSFIEVTQIKTMERVEKTTQFFQNQLTDSRKKLIEADQKLSEFAQKNPYLHNDISRNEFMRLREHRQEILDELIAKDKLIQYYKSKIRDIKTSVTKPLNAVRFQFRNEIEQLEYERLKYISEGYSPEHPGIHKIEEKIQKLKDIIANKLEKEANSNIAMESDSDMRIKELSQRILNIQDEIESKKIALKHVDERIRDLGPTFELLPEREAIYNRLKRDLDVASQLYLQLSSQVSIMNVRSASENGNWSIVSDPSEASEPIGVIPKIKIAIFGIAIGIAFAISLILIRECIDPRLLNRDDAEMLGFIYCGKISNKLSEQAEVLSTLSLIGANASNESKSVITCASPDPAFDLKPVQYLTSYLSTQGYATLTIILGDIFVPGNYGAPVSIEYANIYRHPDGKQDLVQVADRDTFVSLQNLIASSKNRYHAIFLLFKDPLKNPSYPLGLKMSSRLLLIGPKHMYTMEKYHELSRGFAHADQLYFAFGMSQKDQVRIELEDLHGPDTQTPSSLHYITKIYKDMRKSKLTKNQDSSRPENHIKSA